MPHQKLAQKEEKYQVLYLQECIEKNPEARNPKEIRPFEYIETEKITH